MNIIWLESFSEEEQTVKQKPTNDLTFTFTEKPLQSISVERVSEASIVTTRTHSEFPEHLLDHIECVISRSTGYDHLIDSPLVSTDIPVGYLPDYATRAVAEHNLLMAMALLRKVKLSQESARSFERSSLTGRELSSVNHGIVGVGRIGRQTAKLLHSVGVEGILGHDQVQENQWYSDFNFSYVSLKELFDQSDVIYLCLPNTSETAQLVSKEHLMSMNEPGYLINSGRGEVVSNQVLETVLNEGPIEGLALDVFNQENQLAAYLSEDENHDPSAEVQSAKNLIDDPRVLATPHNAFNTRNALDRKVSKTLRNIRSFMESGTVLDPIPIQG